MLQDVELDVKRKTENEMGPAKTLCSPFDQPELLEGIFLIQMFVLLNLTQLPVKICLMFYALAICYC
jgi:hypothetical protein